jgi:hypothetical protein
MLSHFFPNSAFDFGLQVCLPVNSCCYKCVMSSRIMTEVQYLNVHYSCILSWKKGMRSDWKVTKINLSTVPILD